MNDSSISVHAHGAPHALPDDILIDAVKMFLPEAPNLDMNLMVEQAIHEMRNIDDAVKYRGRSLEKAKWEAGDPVCIAHYTMMFVKPALAGQKEHHDWHGRLLRILREREDRFFGSGRG